MTRHSKRFNSSVPSRIILVLILLFAFSCSENNGPEYPNVLQDVSSELIYHLENSNDSTLADYVREIGFMLNYDYLRLLGRRYYAKIVEYDSMAADEILSYLLPYSRVFSSEYNYPYCYEGYKRLDSLSFHELYQIAKLQSHAIDVANRSGLTKEERIKEYNEILQLSTELGDSGNAALFTWHLAGIYDDIGEDELALQYRYKACTRFLELKNYRSACQALGVIGSIKLGLAQTDSMFIYYEKAKEIANRCRMPGQAPRILIFYAGYYIRQGRFSLASELINEALKLCREYKGGCIQLRYIRDAMLFHSRLGSWKAIRRLLMNAHLMEKDCRDELIDSYHRIYLSIEQIEMRMKLAEGKIDEAESMYNRIKQETLNLPYPYYEYKADYLRLFRYYAAGLLDNNLPEKALPVILEGIQVAKKTDEYDFLAVLMLLHAKAEYSLGNYKLSQKILEEFDQLAIEFEEKMKREWVERDAILGKIYLRIGDSDDAMRSLEKGLHRLNEYILNMDASVQSYMWICMNDDLRELLHDLISFDPKLGYGAELQWRDYYRRLGQQTRGRTSQVTSRMAFELNKDMPDRANGSIIDDFKFRSEEAVNRLAKLKATHCLYLICKDEIWRWTATSNGIHKDILEVPAGDVQKLIEEAWETMSAISDQNAYISLRLSKDLRKLANILLPDELLIRSSSSVGNTIFITADKFLGQIPFEAFNIGTEKEYLPLLSKYDIAYLRHVENSHRQSGKAPGVVLVNAQISKELDYKYIFQRKLSQTHSEGTTIAAIDPNVHYLEGTPATKSNLLSCWEEASFIYIASHIFRNPEVPYLMLIPLTPPEGTGGPHESYIDFRDIRSADFSECNLVVLSGCSSGAPYVDAHSVGPSLGDAFLDAGANAVVQTFWDVRDENASKLMKSYINSWEAPDFDKIHSLCEIRRKALQSPQGPRHPSTWAAYAIKIGKL